MNFEDIQNLEDLAMVSEEGVWQHFERLAAFIFEKNNFSVKVNTVKTHQKTKRQFDVIARKGNQTFLVECKKWAGNRYRLSALKKAVEQHKERTLFYAVVTNEDAIPLLVTLIEEDIRFYEGVPIVGIQKLNGFVRELDGYMQGDCFCGCDCEYENDISYEDDIPYEDNLPLPDEIPMHPYGLYGPCEREL
ncbi:MAG TPA: restriction endonuclease [Methanoregula sp.]|nr:restriction endonuclease [Methanoregula sp.]